ncbi:hypothetical protein GALMADRAFT_232567 [Galerina marginata CBS 339.88]|uniref:MYND-type domain-containing protein n=1 Tax=Galerina marginata (strain CBS 339.88) TaxID=685588 RepID=A0A067S8S7_GALM3|nr:hypothetical protein GALMADRAFT_232567 [Galerina marginata CBS 339.88]
MQPGEQVPSVARRCFQCFGKRGRRFICAGCHRAYYCDKACQTVHRPHHRRYCNDAELPPDPSLGVAWLEANKDRVIRISLGLLMLDAVPDASHPLQARLAKMKERTNAWAPCFTLAMLQVDPRLPPSTKVVIDTATVDLVSRDTARKNRYEFETEGKFVMKILLKVHSFNDANYCLESKIFSLCFKHMARFQPIPRSRTEIDLEIAKLLEDNGVEGFVNNLLLQLAI